MHSILLPAGDGFTADMAFLAGAAVVWDNDAGVETGAGADAGAGVDVVELGVGSGFSLCSACVRAGNLGDACGEACGVILASPSLVVMESATGVEEAVDAAAGDGVGVGFFAVASSSPNEKPPFCLNNSR